MTSDMTDANVAVRIIPNRYADNSKQESVKLRELLYASDMSAVEHAYELNDFARMRTLLADTARFPERGFEWSYWNKQTHRCLQSLLSHAGPIKSAAISPVDGALFTTDEAGYVRQWDTATGHVVMEIPNTCRAQWFALSSDGRLMLTYDMYSEHCQLWDLSAKNPVLLKFQYKGFGRLSSGITNQFGLKSEITTCAILGLPGLFYAFSEYIAPAPNGREVDGINVRVENNVPVLRNSGNGARIASLAGHKGTIYSIRFSPDRRYIATTSRDCTTILYNARSGEEVRALAGHTDAVRVCEFSPDGKYIVTGSDDRTAIVWEVATGNRVLDLRGHEAPLTDVKYFADGKKIVTASRDGTAKIWDATPQDGPICKRAGEINTVHVLPDSNSALFCDSSGNMISVDCNTRQLRTIATLHHGEPQDLCTTSRCTTAAVAGADGVACVVDLRSGRTLMQTPPVYGSLQCSAIASDGSLLAVGGRGKSVGLYNIQTGARVHLFSNLADTIYSLAFSPDGSLLAAACADGTVLMWSVSSGRLLRMFRGHSDVCYSVAFSIDGSRIVTGSRDQTARVWDVRTGKQLLLLQGHNANVYSARFSPDGKRVVTAGGRYIRLWELQYGRDVLTLTPTAGDVSSAEFSSNGEAIIASTSLGEVFRWSVRSDSTAEKLHSAHVIR